MVKWMNETYFQSMFAIFDEKTFFCLFGHFLGNFCALFLPTSINDSLTIELNYLLDWISRIFFEFDNVLNWILAKAILNRILSESFFGNIQTLNWIRLGIAQPYPYADIKASFTMEPHMLPPTPHLNALALRYHAMLCYRFKHCVNYGH